MNQNNQLTFLRDKQDLLETFKSLQEQQEQATILFQEYQKPFLIGSSKCEKQMFQRFINFSNELNQSFKQNISSDFQMKVSRDNTPQKQNQSLINIDLQVQISQADKESVQNISNQSDHLINIDQAGDQNTHYMNTYVKSPHHQQNQNFILQKQKSNSQIYNESQDQLGQLIMHHDQQFKQAKILEIQADIQTLDQIKNINIEENIQNLNLQDQTQENIQQSNDKKDPNYLNNIDIKSYLEIDNFQQKNNQYIITNEQIQQEEQNYSFNQQIEIPNDQTQDQQMNITFKSIDNETQNQNNEKLDEISNNFQTIFLNQNNQYGNSLNQSDNQSNKDEYDFLSDHKFQNKNNEQKLTFSQMQRDILVLDLKQSNEGFDKSENIFKESNKFTLFQQKNCINLNDDVWNQSTVNLMKNPNKQLYLDDTDLIKTFKGQHTIKLKDHVQSYEMSDYSQSNYDSPHVSFRLESDDDSDYEQLQIQFQENEKDRNPIFIQPLNKKYKKIKYINYKRVPDIGQDKSKIMQEIKIQNATFDAENFFGYFKVDNFDLKQAFPGYINQLSERGSSANWRYDDRSTDPSPNKPLFKLEYNLQKNAQTTQKFNEY